MEDLSAIAAFVRVVEARSFAAAAPHLGMSASGVSRAISRLEARLGVRLLARSTRSLSVTEEGRLFYERCRRILTDLSEATDIVREARERPSGRLRVAATTSIGRAALLPFLPDFHARYPDIQLELLMGDRAIDMIEEGVDCAIRIGDLADSSLIARRVGRIQLITCASPAYLERRGAPRTLDELDGHECIGYVKPPRGVLTWDFQTDEGRTSIDVQPKLAINDAESVIQACIMGLGIIQTGDYVAAPYIKRGELVSLFETQMVPGPAMSVVYPQRRHLSARVQVFIDWICEHFEEASRCCKQRKAAAETAADATERARQAQLAEAG